MEKIIKELEQKKSELLKEVETIGKAIKLLSKKDISPAEKWVLELIDGMRPTTDSSGNIYWWNKDGYYLFTQVFINGWLLVSEGILVSLENKFGLDRYETEELLVNILYDYTNNGKLKIKQL